MENRSRLLRALLTINEIAFFFDMYLQICYTNYIFRNLVYLKIGGHHG